MSYKGIIPFVIYVLITLSILPSPAFAAATKRGVALWPCGVIPYDFGDNLTQTERNNLNIAIGIWRSAGIQFVPKTTEQDYIIIFRTSSDLDNSWASVGKMRGAHPIVINLNKLDKILHELGHVIGLVHEHQRTDRDTKVKINKDNIIPTPSTFFTWQFDKKEGDLLLTTEYDLESVMHYTANDGLTADAIRDLKYSIEPVSIGSLYDNELIMLLKARDHLTELDKMVLW